MGQPVWAAHNMVVRYSHNRTQYVLPTHVCHEVMCVTNSLHTHNMVTRYAHKCTQYGYAKMSVSNSHVSQTLACHELMCVANSSVSRSHLRHKLTCVTNPRVSRELMCVTNSCVSRHNMVMRILGPFMQGLYGCVVTYWFVTLNVCVCVWGGQAYMVMYCKT